MENENLAEIHAALDALLKAACPYEETDTPELSTAINRGMRTRDFIRELIEQQLTKG